MKDTGSVGPRGAVRPLPARASLIRGRLALLLACAAHAGAMPYAIVGPNGDLRQAAARVMRALQPGDEGETPPSTAWARLAHLSDTFGGRPGGSQALEDALGWIIATAVQDGLGAASLPSTLPVWERGREEATLVTPSRTMVLHVRGLTGAVGTPSGALLTAPLLVVTAPSATVALVHLRGNCSASRGAILLLNAPFPSYDALGPLPTVATACGAVAVLVRSVGPLTPLTPRGGGCAVNATIPLASVHVEEAARMQRLQARGVPSAVSLLLSSSSVDPRPSLGTLLLELGGTGAPNEVVLIAAQVDSASDDAAGAADAVGLVTAWEALRTLAALVQAGTIPRPRRTLRLALWLGGAPSAYPASQSATLLGDHSWLLEAGMGAYTPTGITLRCAGNASSGGCAAALEQLAAIGADLLGARAGRVLSLSDEGAGAGVSAACAAGVPCSRLTVADPRAACMDLGSGAWATPGAEPSACADEMDGPERIDSPQLNAAASSLAVWAYAVAQLPSLLPRDALPLPAAGDDYAGIATGFAATIGLVGGAAALLTLLGGSLAYARCTTPVDVLALVKL